MKEKGHTGGAVVHTAGLTMIPYRFRAINLSDINKTLVLRAAVRASGFRHYDSAKPDKLGAHPKNQIETSREETAVAFFEASVPRGDQIEYLLQIVNISNQKVIRTYTPDFSILRSGIYTWVFDGRDFLSRPGQKPLAEEGYYTARIQLRSQGRAATVFFDNPLRVVHRAARFSVIDGWGNGLGDLIAQGIGTSKVLPSSNILEKLKPIENVQIQAFRVENEIEKSDVRRYFRNAGFTGDYADFLIVVVDSDFHGILKVFPETPAKGFVIFDPSTEQRNLRWINTPRWVLMLAPRGLALHVTKWMNRQEFSRIVPDPEGGRELGSDNILATFHPGAYWFNCIRNTGLRGLLGYWGELPSSEELRWVAREFLDVIHKGENFLSAWRQANSAVSRQWAAFVRENASEDSMKSMADGLPTSSSEWRYWDNDQVRKRVEAAYREMNYLSKSYRPNQKPEFHPVYDSEVMEEEIPRVFDIYSDDVRI